MATPLLPVFLSLLLYPIVLTSLTIKCDDNNFSIISDILPMSHHVPQLVLEECPLYNIPHILSNISMQGPLPTSLILKRSKHPPVVRLPSHYKCSSNVKYVNTVTLAGCTPQCPDEDYSGVLAYLSQCTSVSNLEILDTSLRQVTHMESGQTLQSLRLSNNHIAELQLESLSGLSKLTVLDLSSNKLVRIPSRVFKSNRRLRRLNLSNNVISNINRHSFIGILPLNIFIGNSSYFYYFRSASFGAP